MLVLVLALAKSSWGLSSTLEYHFYLISNVSTSRKLVQRLRLVGQSWYAVPVEATAVNLNVWNWVIFHLFSLNRHRVNYSRFFTLCYCVIGANFAPVRLEIIRFLWHQLVREVFGGIDCVRAGGWDGFRRRGLVVLNVQNWTCATSRAKRLKAQVLILKFSADALPVRVCVQAFSTFNRFECF